MESNWGGLNYEPYYQGLVELVNIMECDCLLWRYENYIHQTKHDGLCGQQKVYMDYSRE